MKYFDMTAEQLVHCFGAYSVDDVIWWNYIRWKHFKIEPQWHISLLKKLWEQ